MRAVLATARVLYSTRIRGARTWSRVYLGRIRRVGGGRDLGGGWVVGVGVGEVKGSERTGG